MEQEIFKPIKGYEEYYEVSNFGRVKSLAKEWSVGRKEDTILKEGHRKKGYDFVVLCVDKIKKYASIHRLVAEHFCEAKDGCDIVNHLDSDIYNNKASNLEWTTYSGNTIHGYEKGFMKGRKGESHHNNKLTSAQVEEIKKVYKMGGISQKELGKLYNICQAQIWRIVNGTRWNSIVNK